LYVVDGAYNIVVATIPTGELPWKVAVNEVTGKIYVTGLGNRLTQTGSNISIIDGNTNTLIKTIPVAPRTQVRGITASPITNRVYVCHGSTRLIVIDGVTDTISTEITMPDYINQAVVNTSTNKVYLSAYSSDAVFVLDGHTNTVVANVAVGDGPEQITVNEITNTVYVANFNVDSVSVIDGTTNTVTATLALGRAKQ
jgi:YVTN family beta-propeller protein